MSDDLLSQLAADWPPERWRDVTVLVAVSGGADSVALTRALHALRTPGEGRLVLAHFNHRLRGAESDADQQFVERLAEQLGLPSVVASAQGDLSAGGSGEGVEGAARQARYEFLTAAASQAGARYVATAHTADDQAETVLFNILRGTGLAGLAGIPRSRRLSEAATLVRPLLAVSRTGVLAYLQFLGQPFRDDSTNELTQYSRNRLRHELLPQLEREYNPRVREALLRLAQIAGEADDFLTHEASPGLQNSARMVPGGVELLVRSKSSEHPLLSRYMLMAVWKSLRWPLQDMSFEKWEELRSMAAAVEGTAPSAQMFPGGVRAERLGEYLRLTRAK
jgi:tRNA(Ile)-lysidine synthase